MNNEVPDFQSDIPAHLLTNASPQDKYIMENLSILGQKSNWLAESQKFQSQALRELKAETSELKAESKEIRIQTTKTNGRVTALEEGEKRAQNVINFYSKAKETVSNKFAILAMVFGLVCFFSYVAPWLQTNGKMIIPNIIKLFFGA